MKSLFEEMGGTYTKAGDYYIPDIVLPEQEEYQIGKYGNLHRSYLKEHRPILYANCITSGTLYQHLAEIDKACHERMEILCDGMAEREGVTDAQSECCAAEIPRYAGRSSHAARYNGTGHYVRMQTESSEH